MEQNIKYQVVSNKLKFLFIMFVANLLIAGCSEEKHEPIGSDMSVPQSVSDITYTPLAGGALITYALPDDANLLCVEAELLLPNGRKMNYTSSSYKNEITILGLANTQPQKVQLYSVSKNGVKSNAASIDVTPLPPPYEEVLKTVTLRESWGGIGITAQNESEGDLAYFLGYYDERGVFVDYDSYYSSIKSDTFAIRGLPNETKKFGLYIRDRWDNFSDTLFADLTPLQEEMIEKKNFRMMELDGDGIYGSYNNEQPENIWNGVWGTDWNNNYGDWKHFIATDGVTQDNATFTMDIGVLTKLSRIILNQYYRYEAHMPKKYEIWGLVDYDSDLITTAMGDWSNWTLLGTMENRKEVDVPGPATATAKDVENWLKGDEMIFDPEPSPPVRYIRYKSLGSWNGRNNFSIAEITYFGQPMK